MSSFGLNFVFENQTMLQTEWNDFCEIEKIKRGGSMGISLKNQKRNHKK